MKPIITNSFLTLSILVTFSAMAGTNSWTPVAIGPAGTYIAIVRFDDLNPLIGYVGSYNQGLFKTTDGGMDWFSIGPEPIAPHPFVSVTDVATDPTNSSTLYGFAFGWPASFTNSVFKSLDGGSNWVSMGSGLPTFDNNLQPSPIAVDPTNPATLLLEAHTTSGSSPSRLFRSTDAGTNWSEIITTGLSVQRIYELAFDPIVPQRIYAVADGGIYVSTNGGTNWSQHLIGGGATPTVIRLDKSRPGTIFVGSNGGPYKSTDGGLTWVSTPTLGEQSLAMSIDRYIPDVIFSGGTEGKLFRSQDRGNSYDYLATLPGFTPVMYLLEFQPATKTIFAGGLGTLYSWTIVEPPMLTIGSSLIVKCPTQVGFSYQLQESSDLVGWTNTGSLKTGDGFVQCFTNSTAAKQEFYRVFFQ